MDASRRLLNAVVLALATGLGLGMIPYASGTFGSLLGPPLVWGVQQLARSMAPEGTHFPLYAVLAFAIILLASPVCGAGAKHFKEKDPGHVVFDEIVSFFLVFLFVTVTWRTAIFGFLWFRLFDITKPWPARQLENLRGGWGVLADDLVAAFYAGVCLWGTVQLLDLLGGTTGT